MSAYMINELRHDFQQCGIWTSVDSDEPKLRSSKWCSVNSLRVIEYQETSKGSDQTARIRRLVWAIAGRTYHIVGNLLSQLIIFFYSASSISKYQEVLVLKLIQRHSIFFLTLCMLVIFSCFWSSAELLQNFFKKFFQAFHQSVKKLGFRSGPTFFSCLIWIQTVCKGYQQTAGAGNELTYPKKQQRLDKTTGLTRV